VRLVVKSSSAENALSSSMPAVVESVSLQPTDARSSESLLSQVQRCKNFLNVFVHVTFLHFSHFYEQLYSLANERQNKTNILYIKKHIHSLSYIAYIVNY